MLAELAECVVESIKSATQKLTGWKRREFQAETALTYCDGSPRKAERIFGWGRQAVEKGLNEKRTGIRVLDNVHARGRKRTEEQNPELAVQIRALADPQSQADPKFQTPLAFTRITAKAVCQELGKTGSSEVPSERSMHRILNRMGYSTRRVRKTKPKKNP
ncbi:MAG: hypothetical protein O3C40_29840 [Planctomycetota bacterium]|nr:hypothetical protein [Planctomycetota bacterium]